MAVIREKQQFRNQRIGVVKMDTGAENYYNTVANAADNLTQIAFKEAGRQAQEKGKETAEAVRTQALRTINPETGKPEAYNVPEKFGTVAQASYEEVLDRRFINDIDQQIKDRGRDLFLKYQNDPHGVEKYSQSMEDYVAQMIEPKNNAGILNDRFKNIIKDTGAAFIASTKFNLMSKRAAIVADQLRAGLDQDAINASEEIVSVIQTRDPLDYEGGEATRTSQLIAELAIAEMDVGLESGILTVPQHKANVQSILKALPEGMLTNRMNYNSSYVDDNNVTKQMNSDVGILIESAIDTGIIPDNLPKSLVPQVQEILDLDGYKENKKSIQQKVGDLRLGLERREQEGKGITAQQEADARVYDGQKINPQDPVNQKAFDNLIIRGSKSLSSQKFPNLIEYYLSNESLSDGNIYALVERQNLFGEQFISALKMGAGANTGWTKENYQTALTHFETFTNVNILGSPANKLNQFLSPDEMAFYRSLSSLTKQDGSQENLLQNVAKLNAVYDDPARLNDRLSQIFKTDKPKAALKDFLNEAFPANRRMQEMARPLVELMAFTGSNADQIKKELLGMYENQYVKTNGIVIDMFDPDLDRSIFAPHALLGSKDLRSFYINGTTYINSLSDGGYALSENPVGKAKNKIVRLYPVTMNAAQPDIIEYEYTIQDGDEEKTRTGQLQTFQYMAVTVQDNGEITPILDKRTGAPIYIGTEIAQTEIMEQAKKVKQAEINEQNRKASRQLEADIEFERLKGTSSP